MLQYGVLLLICVTAVISAVIFCLCAKNKINVRTIVFFATITVFILSVIKYKLEGARLTLVQSFWEASLSTYIHYGIPLLIVSIISPVAIHFMLRGRAEKIIDWQAVLSTIIFSVSHLLFGKITNLVFIICFIIISFLTIILSHLYDERLIFLDIDTFYLLLKKYWGILWLPSFLILFYYPNELFITNVSEFANPVGSFEMILLIGMLLGVFALCCVIFTLPKKWMDIVVSVVFAFSFAGYLQVMIFNGALGMMIGQHQQWETGKFLINAVLWLFIISLSVLGCIKIKKYISYINAVSLFIISMLLVTCVTLFVQNMSQLKDRGYSELSIDGDLNLASQDNVLVFVLDMYDTRLVDEIENSDAMFFDPLKDFTLYDDAIARHSYTAISIPYLLTASEWAENEVAFKEYAYEGNTFLSKLYSNGIDIGAYTSKAYFGQSANYMIRNASENVRRESDFINTISVMSRASFFKMMPFMCKENYFYYSGDITDMVKSGDVWSIDNDVPFYERINERGITISPDISSTFRFYHMRGAHYPYYLSDNVKIDKTLTQATAISQAKGSMRVVYSYIDELKSKGLYDSTTIIITADHGEIISYDETKGKLSDVSMPVLFVKKAYQHGDGFVRNHAKVSHSELFSTILDAYGIDYTDYGPRLDDIEEYEDKKRYFGYYSDYEGVVSGNVVGNGREVDNWIVN